jgi:hypothetical protein
MHFADWSNRSSVNMLKTTTALTGRGLSRITMLTIVITILFTPRWAHHFIDATHRNVVSKEVTMERTLERTDERNQLARFFEWLT